MVARAIVIKIKNILEFVQLVKNVAVSSLIIKILVYSAIKIKANVDLLYSVLNPDTSSDSPSAKSNGVRFVSAKLVINHMMNIGIIIILNHDSMFIFMVVIFIEW